jgi:hypothetical protein
MGPTSGMAGKARMTLQTAEQLMTVSSQEHFANATANRLYYAAFQAAVFAIERLRLSGENVDKFRVKDRDGNIIERRGGESLYSHDEVVNRAEELSGAKDDTRLFRDLRTLRVIADYSPDPVDSSAFEDHLEDVRAFVRKVCR